MNFLPITKEELEGRQPDFVLVTGDAYVDHPSFGAAVIGRVLEAQGFLVAVLAQPDWRDAASFEVFGKPRLGFLVTGGNIDSMVSNYTVAKKRREKDLYSPGAKPGLRPDRALIVYGNKIREAYKDTVIILGGLEASLRRLSHFDYWDGSVRRSALLDASADILVYGMGERAIIQIAKLLDKGVPASSINIKGIVRRVPKTETIEGCVELPSYKEAKSSKAAYAKSFMLQYENTDSISAKGLIERYPDAVVVQNPPAAPLTKEEFDGVYNLSFMRMPHPAYDKDGGVPACEEVSCSVISSRGCFGGCNFCALSFHQGRHVQGRSHESILKEVGIIAKDPRFKGYIHDVGGPTANFRKPSCKGQSVRGVCPKKQCLFPAPCKNLEVDHEDYRSLLKKIREQPGIKKVFVRSGIRYDYLLQDKSEAFLRELIEHHISGQLKVAPEHVSPKVLDKMGKPRIEAFEKFLDRYEKINEKLGMKQFLVPYLMSSHPGSGLNEAIELAEYLRDMGIRPEQAQDFYPTPGTLSTCMYYTEMDPRTGERVHVAKSPHEKAMQRALIQYRLPQNHELVKEALTLAGRRDLIGFAPKCLIRPRELAKTQGKPVSGQGKAKAGAHAGDQKNMKNARNQRNDRKMKKR
ncbi:MAG: YgiQ family radical SAM protein [Clostridiales bacterium]|jgi:uncharacterized radical SAM protein YgiQ|nr:YgiQ family radical SAM protein [Clostridiales bacterium]